MEPERESKKNKTCIIKRRNLKALHHHGAIRGRMQRQSEKKEKDKRLARRDANRASSQISTGIREGLRRWFWTRPARFLAEINVAARRIGLA